MSFDNNNDKGKNLSDNFNKISISIASPEDILAWSHGEVKKPETINYRTQKPERDGLFCERIFGPTKNWECYCGKYKRVRYKGVICEKCGVEVTHASVRRERMAHIKLAVPVTHIWFLRSTPSRIGLLLDLPIKSIEQVVYFAAYIIISVDEEAKAQARTQLNSEYKSIRKKLQEEAQKKISETKDQKLKTQLEETYAQKIEEFDTQHSTTKEELEAIKIGKIYTEIEYRHLSIKFGQIFRAGIGAEAIRDIIQNLNLEKLIKELDQEMKKATGQKQKKLMKRIKLAGSLLKSNIKPEWMIMTILPVIPPDLRPMVQLDGGRYAASDLNDLYRRVINRNNRLKKLMSIGAPEVICRNEKRMLQEAVDTLLNNSARQNKTVFNSGDKRKLRSLSDMLKGKQGRFRQNLLGKRVDYSGRSVIVVGPKLKLHQCGLPKTMALELFKPFVIGKLIRDGHAHNIKNAEKLIQSAKREVWDILEEITKDHYVLLNRAPTLHRLGIQAFQPVLVEGKAIQIHPLVCSAFNADFDGDQMAVHVPLSKQAQLEAKSLIVSSKNLLKPAAGEPIVTPVQDMVLGCYYLTKLTRNKPGEGMIISSIEEGIIAWRLNHLHLQSPIKARVNNKIIETTLGRLIFNSFLPEQISFMNETIGKKQLSKLVETSYNLCGQDLTAKMVDDLKRIGFQFATHSGLTIASSDMIVPPQKEEIISEASNQIKEISKLFELGLTTDDERYRQTIKVWTKAKAEITNTMIKGIDEENNLHYMINSGARGTWGQITQLCGIKGLVANPAGKTIELPIKSNLKEGFTILEYFIATHGGRKGKSDTALRTAEAGHLTRRLVDAVQDIVTRDFDCGSKIKHVITKEECEKIGESIGERSYGRVLAAPIIDKKSGEILLNEGDVINRDNLALINSSNLDQIEIRSIMTCQTLGGICIKCYGLDLANNKMVEIGTPVGIIAAQSIGEPGTQLTMRTFHMGGVAEEGDITLGLTRVDELFEARSPKFPAILSEIDGKVKVISKGNQTEIIITSDGPVDVEFKIDSDFKTTLNKNDQVKEKEIIAKSETNKATIKSTVNGKVVEVTPEKIVIRSNEEIQKSYKIPFGKIIKVSNGNIIKKGDPLTSGHYNLREYMELTSIYHVQKYLLREVQTIYSSQGQTINDKQFEIIVRQMFSKVRILDSGDSPFLAGEVIDLLQFEITNRKLIEEGKNPSKAERLLLGLTRIALQTDSWLAAASFQETIRVLVEASTTQKVDNLEGLKENVIIGKLIPAGETYKKRHIPNYVSQLVPIDSNQFTKTDKHPVI